MFIMLIIFSIQWDKNFIKRNLNIYFKILRIEIIWEKKSNNNKEKRFQKSVKEKVDKITNILMFDLSLLNVWV